MTVLHYDSDYDLIADVTGQPVQWVVPRGPFPDHSLLGIEPHRYLELGSQARRRFLTCGFVLLRRGIRE